MDKCSICMNNIDNNIDNIIYKCNDNRHFYCEDCMKHFLSTIRNDYNFINNYERNNQIKCYSCDSHFEHNILLNSSINDVYVNTTRNMIETITARNNELENRSNSNNDIFTVIRNLLTECISCPYCNQAFVDFDGCLALRCSRCSKDFCGICLEKHYNESNRHSYIKYHTSRLSKQQIRKYKMNGILHMNIDIWNIYIKEKIQVKKICEKISELPIIYRESNINNIIMMISSQKLLSEISISKLKKFIKIFDNNYMITNYINKKINYIYFSNIKDFLFLDDNNGFELIKELLLNIIKNNIFVINNFIYKYYEFFYDYDRINYNIILDNGNNNSIIKILSKYYNSDVSLGKIIKDNYLNKCTYILIKDKQIYLDSTNNNTYLNYIKNNFIDINDINNYCNELIYLDNIKLLDDSYLINIRRT